MLDVSSVESQLLQMQSTGDQRQWHWQPCPKIMYPTSVWQSANVKVTVTVPRPDLMQHDACRWSGDPLPMLLCN